MLPCSLHGPNYALFAFAVINSTLSLLLIARMIIILHAYSKLSGPGCSKLTTSLGNETLKFQTLISQICQYYLLENVRSFCTAKASPIFSTKNTNVLGYKVVKHLTS